MFRHSLPLFLFSFCAALAARADTFATDWKVSGPSNSRIILEASGVNRAGNVRAGVQVHLQDGWWTYWRAPGTSGIPPQFDWSGSENILGKPELKWPVPIRAISHGEALNLYRNEIVFPVEFRAADPKRPVVLKLKLTYGVCRNMCVPATVDHAISIAASSDKTTRNQANVRLISAYSNQQPSADPTSTGFEIREVWEATAGHATALGLRLSGLKPPRKQLVLLEGQNIFQASEIMPRPTADENESILTVPLGGQQDVRKLTGKRLRITIVDGGRALEQVWVVGTTASSATGTGLTPVSAGPSDRPQP
jgi:suppressor for copper-sensitivity B